MKETFKKRYIGDAEIWLRWAHDGFYGKIKVPRNDGSGKSYTWRFDTLRPPAAGDDSEDAMAAAAVGFGSYFTTHNRGSDTPDWAPKPDVADAIEEATAWAMDDQGRHFVRRKRNSEKGVWR